MTVRDGIADALTGTTDDDSLFRALSHLPAVASSAVQIVQADSVCQQAAAAMIAAGGSGSSGDGVWVIRAGTTHYVVFNPAQRSEERTIGFVFDAAFLHLTSIVL